MTEITIDIVRHGETYLNQLGRAQGWIDMELNKQGLEQASQTGKALADVYYNVIISSDLKRAVQTRDRIIKHLKHVPDVASVKSSLVTLKGSTPRLTGGPSLCNTVTRITTTLFVTKVWNPGGT